MRESDGSSAERKTEVPRRHSQRFRAEGAADCATTTPEQPDEDRVRQAEKILFGVPTPEGTAYRATVRPEGPTANSVLKAKSRPPNG
jgi:hypothetical protein